jgi:MSHA pilin protein MshA
MKNNVQGFTLIELVIVIIILGILSAFAIPRFIDLSADANTAATNGVAGALSSANGVNYAARKANASLGVAVSNCTNVASALQSGTLPSASYTITSAAVSVNATVSCTLTGPGGVTATFTATGIS